MKKRDLLIIGGGIVGLASAYQLLQKKPHLQITIFEKEKEVALHQTGRNSGVIHSGIYYKPGSLKAINATRGKHLLLSFCEKHHIPTKKVGKVIVAIEKKDILELNRIEEKGRANGVTFERIGATRLREIEPHVKALEAIWIPECRILSYTTVANKLSQELQNQGVEILCNQKVKSLHTSGEGVVLQGDTEERAASFFINAAGLFSDRIAKLEEKTPCQILPFRGEYYELVETKRDLVKGLIYPVPDPRFPFLGVHLTRMIDGNVEAGPNAILAWMREGYQKRDFSWRDTWEILRFPGFWKIALKYWDIGLYEMARSMSKRLFLRDLQKLVPSLEEKDLIPRKAGIRAQAVDRNGRLLDDFSLVKKERSLHILNAPSPAATASFAIGEQVADEVFGCT